MRYRLDTPLSVVKGIGPVIAQAFSEAGFFTVKDVLLFVPLRYEDRSLRKKISELVPDEVATIEAEVVTAKNFYKGRRSIQSATIKDETGTLKLMWFNNPHILGRVQPHTTLLFAGKLNDRGTLVQPIVETPSDDTTHTGRLVPMYSGIPGIAPATLRKLFKHIIDSLQPIDDPLTQLPVLSLESLSIAIQQLHFPDSEETIVRARERFALEELLELIHRSHELKLKWREGADSLVIADQPSLTQNLIKQLPFTLTNAQLRCITEVLADLRLTTPMNRLLVGDVGSGKTVVVGIAAAHVLTSGANVALVAPTQILAEQHMATFQKFFPSLHVELLTAKTKLLNIRAHQATLYIGTHAILNALGMIKPALLIYDEQHRFGVEQRSLSHQLQPRPHVLTLSATPIPRTLMLSIFSHLQLSVIDELPAGRQQVKTWLIPEPKRDDAYRWLLSEVQAHNQALIVCPFIDPSENEGLEHIAAATEMFRKIKTVFAKDTVSVGLLHGRLSKKEQAVTTAQLYSQNIDVLVTTPIVEVGVDLPAASVIVIEAAERFGLASLHQMRGRVGRAGQAAYCLLFTNSKGVGKKRLETFCHIHNGVELAEFDLQRRGAGDIFGTQQHGFESLQFASWTNVELIMKAKQLAEAIETQHIVWQPFLQHTSVDTETVPLAN